jgi:hypothetical protein
VNEVRTWWTDGEYISNLMEETEEQLADSDFFQVVQKSDYDSLQSQLSAKEADIAEMNKNCISLNLHESRVWALEKQLAERAAEIVKLRDALERVFKHDDSWGANGLRHGYRDWIFKNETKS